MITVLTWPLMSSDMNPCKNLWQRQKGGLNRRSPKKLPGIRNISLKRLTCSNLIKIFRKWFQRVLKIRVNATDYWCSQNCSLFFNFSSCLKIILHFSLFLNFSTHIFEKNLSFSKMNILLLPCVLNSRENVWNHTKTKF